MSDEIILSESGHIYIDLQDISKYVISSEILDNETLQLTLRGKIKDERKKEKPKKKKVKNDR